jgi:hypothetical protein
VRRDDLYTLFIITRMINFLKGLKLPEELLTLEEALQVAAESGAAMLWAPSCCTPAAGGRLYAAHGQRRILLPHFSSSLFQRVMDALKEVKTLSDGTVIIGKGLKSGYGVPVLAGRFFPFPCSGWECISPPLPAN